jgi:hypothetical protein
MAGDNSNMSPHQNWQSLGAGGLNGANNVAGSGTSVARSELDSVRIGTGRVPTAEYPDGLLSTIRSRRDDRLLDSIKNRINQKGYQRGVHKGERIEPGNYMWPVEFNAQQGLKRESRAILTENGYVAKRFANDPRLVPAPHLVNDGKANTLANEPTQINQTRSLQLAYLKPQWS